MDRELKLGVSDLNWMDGPRYIDLLSQKSGINAEVCTQKDAWIWKEIDIWMAKIT